jgi:hypothetical protein
MDDPRARRYVFPANEPRPVLRRHLTSMLRWKAVQALPPD